MPETAARRSGPEGLLADTRRVVVGDLHGDHRGLQKLLRQIGVIDWNGNRQPGYYVVQLGDLVHVGPGTVGADVITIELAHKWVDLVLCGNHELLHAYGLSCGWFLGIDEEADIVGPLLKNMVEDGQLRPAAALDGWLLTHAGLHPRYARRFVEGGVPDAAAVAARLNDAFDEALAPGGGGIPAVFSSVGAIRSGGQDLRPGGLFWADASEMKGAAADNTVPQIFGHTPQSGFPRRIDERMWCADVGAALSGVVVALVQDPGEEGWKPVVTGVGK